MSGARQYRIMFFDAHPLGLPWHTFLRPKTNKFVKKWCRMSTWDVMGKGRQRGDVLEIQICSRLGLKRDLCSITGSTVMRSDLGLQQEQWSHLVYMFVRTHLGLQRDMWSNKGCTFVRTHLGLKRDLSSNVAFMFV